MEEISALDISFALTPAASESKITLEVDSNNFLLQTETIGGLEWILTYEANSDNGVLSLNCAERETKLWSIDMLVKVEVIAISSEYNNFFDSRSTHLHTSHGTHTVQMFPMSDRGKYEENGILKIEISVTVSRVWQEELAKITSLGSCYITMDETELFVSRELLSMNSIYFHELFERNNAMNVLEDVTYDELMRFLVAVYPIGFKINSSNFMEMLEIARKFKSSSLMTRCVMFIDRSESIPNADRLKIAVEYDLQGLMQSTINKMEQEDIEDVACGRESLPDKLKLLLFDRLIRVHETRGNRRALDEEREEVVTQAQSIFINRLNTNIRSVYQSQFAFLNANSRPQNFMPPRPHIALIPRPLMPLPPTHMRPATRQQRMIARNSVVGNPGIPNGPPMPPQAFTPPYHTSSPLSAFSAPSRSRPSRM